MRSDLVFAFVAALAGIIIGGLVSERSVRALAASERRVNRTHEVLEQVRTVRVLLADAEAGQRGYVLTGRDEYLEPYTRALGEIPTEMDRLDDLTAERPAQRDRVARLKFVVRGRLGTLRDVLAVRRDPAGGLLTAVRVIELGRGRALMSELHRLVAELEAEELEELAAGSAAAAAADRATARTLATVTAVGIGLLGALVGLVRRHVRERERAALRLQAAHESLEARVRERTAELATVNQTLRHEALERTRAEDRLRQAAKMEAVGHLAGGVAHDFNNLLMVINGYAAMLLKDWPPDAPDTEPLREILTAGRRAETLTRQLLAFGRRQVLQPKLLDLNTLVIELTKMLARLLGEDVQLATALSSSPVPITADPGQIEQVIVNLCVNARDAMPTGGRVTIATDTVAANARTAGPGPCAPGGRYARVRVTDTGAGMTDEVRAKIFEPFFTTKGPGRGTGLGLATVLGIVEQSGGCVEVSTAVGRGTAFEVYLPVTEGEVLRHASEPESPPPVPGGRETILLVEDEPAVRSLGALALRRAGYAVLEAGNGAEAGAAFAGARGAVRLLVTDVVMPGESGRELAARLVAAAPGLRVLFTSGYTDDAVMRHGILSSEVEFLQKPFEVDALVHKVRDVLDKEDVRLTWLE